MEGKEPCKEEFSKAGEELNNRGGVEALEATFLPAETSRRAKDGGVLPKEPQEQDKMELWESVSDLFRSG